MLAKNMQMNKGMKNATGLPNMPFAGQQNAQAAALNALNQAQFLKPAAMQGPKVGDKRSANTIKGPLNLPSLSNKVPKYATSGPLNLLPKRKEKENSDRDDPS